MSDRSIRTSKTYISNDAQDRLLNDLLDVFDKHAPYKTMDAVEVLTVMIATLLTTHCDNRRHAENVMEQIVIKMDRIIQREHWLEEHPELRRH